MTKKTISILIFLFAFSGLLSPSSTSAVSGLSLSAANPLPIAENPFLTIHYSVNGQVVHLKPGMSKKTIDGLLGAGATYRSIGFDYDRHGDLMIAYENDQAAYFSIQDGERISLNGITSSSNPEDVKPLPGTPNDAGEYLFKESGGSFVAVNPNEDVSAIPASSIYRLRFNPSSSEEFLSFEIERGDFRSMAQERVAASNSLEGLPPKPKPFTMWDLSVLTADGKGRIAIGMSKAAVDKQFGKPTSYQGLGHSRWYVYQGAEVFYRNNKVAGIKLSLSEDFKEDFRTPRGMGLLTNEAKLFRLYGTPSNVSEYSLEYYFYKTNTGLRKLPRFPVVSADGNRPPTDQSYVISLMYSDKESKLIDYIFISDFMFAYELK